tara:strand:+ start:19430 stop:19774 length:345 start_codon:yes stop_codon:yes gene_type:complete
MSDCLFCKISNKEIPSDFIYESDSVLAFNDINPQAPTHVLIIPRKHIATLNDLKSEDRELVGEMHMVAQQIAGERNLSESGYRTVFNCNDAAGQTVFHIHLHLLGGRNLVWPPG